MVLQCVRKIKSVYVTMSSLPKIIEMVQGYTYDKLTEARRVEKRG